MKCHRKHSELLSITARGNAPHNPFRKSITPVFSTGLKLFSGCLFVCFAEREFLNRTGSAKPESLFMGQRRLALGCGHHPYPGSRAAPSAHHMLPPQCQDERGGVSLSGTCCQVLCGGCKTNNLVWADNLEQINVSSADLRINAMTVSEFHSATADLSTVVVWKCWNVTFLKLSFWSLFLWQSSTTKIGVSHFVFK